MLVADQLSPLFGIRFGRPCPSGSRQPRTMGWWPRWTRALAGQQTSMLRKEKVVLMVKMAPKLTFGTETTDWQERLNVARMREYRMDRARAMMRKYGIAAIVEGNQTNMRYLTGLVGFGYPGSRYVLFFAGDEPIVYEHAGHYHQMPAEAPWIKQWRPAQSWLLGSPGPDASEGQAKKFAHGIKAELADRGFENEKIGISGFDAIGMEALREAGVTNLVATGQMMLEARMIKNEDEINCLKTAAAIVEGVWYRVWDALHPGLRDTELGAIASNAGYELGAELAVQGNWRSGPFTFDRGPGNSGRIIQTGDLVYGSLCGLSYLGYRTCTYRTFKVAQQPTQKEKGWYQELRDRVDGVISEMKPGRTTADAAKHFPPATKWGYQDEMEVLASEIGHGIGLGGISGYDAPIVNRMWSFDHPVEFEEGMCLAVESREGEPRVGGVRLENMVVITRDGAEVMDYFPRDEILVAPMALDAHAG